MIKNNLEIKPIPLNDSVRLWELNAKEPFYKWTLTNAPYFNDFKQMTYKDFLSEFQNFYVDNENVQGLYVNNLLIGTLNRYWQDKQTRWLEVGIVIFDESYWNKGYATTSLEMWIQNTFDTFEVERIGLTTWSGNPGMIQVGKKLGMTQDRTVKHARYYKGTYYDSIGYGITRDTWKFLNQSEVNMEIVNDPDLKSQLCEEILRKIPEWFGVEASTLEYIDKVKTMYFIAAKTQGYYSGFIAIDPSHEGFDEIYVMGVDPNYHRCKIGKLLVSHALIKSRLNNKKIMMVKTLSPSIVNQEYDITRRFYSSLGFIALHEDSSIWGEDAPCLIMVRSTI